MAVIGELLGEKETLSIFVHHSQSDKELSTELMS